MDVAALPSECGWTATPVAGGDGVWIVGDRRRGRRGGGAAGWICLAVLSLEIRAVRAEPVASFGFAPRIVDRDLTVADAVVGATGW